MPHAVGRCYLILVAIAILATGAHAQTRGARARAPKKTLEQRDSEVLRRGLRLQYRDHTRAVGVQAQQVSALEPHYKELGSWHGPADEQAVMDAVNRVLAKLPASVTNGARLQPERDRRSFFDDGPSTQARTWYTVVKGVLENLQQQHPDVMRSRSAIAAVETELHKRLDKKFLEGRAAWKQRLQEASPQELYAQAVGLIHLLDDWTARSIRKEPVASGSFSSSASAGTHGLFSGSTFSSSSSGGFKSSQLVIGAATYEVAIRALPPHDMERGPSNVGEFTPIEARMIAEIALEVSEIGHALRRSPEVAATLNNWVENSTVRFVHFEPENSWDLNKGGPSVRLKPVTTELQVIQAARDFEKLVPLGIMSKAVSNRLQGEIKRRVRDRLSQ